MTVASLTAGVQAAIAASNGQCAGMIVPNGHRYGFRHWGTGTATFSGITVSQ